MSPIHDNAANVFGYIIGEFGFRQGNSKMKNPVLIRVFVFASAFVFPLCGFIFSGCFTITGLVVGTAIDKQTGLASTNDLISLEPGTQLTVTMLDSSVILGKFVARASAPLSVYRAGYDTARSQFFQLVKLPALGSVVTLTDPSGNKSSGALLGFDFLKDRAPAIVVTHFNDENRYVIRLAALQSVDDSAGYRTDPKEIILLMRKGQIPALTNEIIMENDGTQTKINLRYVKSIQTKKSRDAWLLGACIGAAIDAMWLLLIYKSVRE